ncbi:craniofacial development protein 2-like [Capsicum annuum]|uniref:craniofacial development protein 2-like n=1 Tax=Capsicum annuum TaxID=4072 RepID=UPI001FB15EEF|nr:craniofacial development protein 2-like [Capsicum annuum]
MSIKLVIEGSTVNVISAYAPQVGLDEKEKKDFWEILDEVVRSILSSEKLLVGGDFNRNIGSLLRGFEDVHGGFGFGERNDGGAALLDFSRAFGLWIANSSFPKKKEHLIMFCSSVGYAKLVVRKDGEERQTNKEEYKVARREAKLAVTAAKIETFECLYKSLEEKCGDKKLYRLAKAGKRRARDYDQVKCNKEEEGIVLVEDALNRERW